MELRVNEASLDPRGIAPAASMTSLQRIAERVLDAASRDPRLPPGRVAHAADGKHAVMQIAFARGLMAGATLSLAGDRRERVVDVRVVAESRAAFAIGVLGMVLGTGAALVFLGPQLPGDWPFKLRLAVFALVGVFAGGLPLVLLTSAFTSRGSRELVAALEEVARSALPVQGSADGKRSAPGNAA
ncbi:MAG: hypothetical protein CMN31_27225 [Sandaracinus sp.]|nr:hypothetical protein [Myxococcales bacterium]MAT26250.1 hypothetical protein [Sandaracinus sp.]MBJ74981.1 hypothetical protein [Sandaracinus sp.]